MSTIIRSNEIRIAEKPVLSIEETAALFSIGEEKLRNMIKTGGLNNCILRVGSWCRIKRKQFEAMIDSVDAI